MFRTPLREERIIGTRNTYKLLEELVWDDGVTLIVVPKGFIYNGGSVPQALWWFIPPKGSKADRAFCLHDFLYASHMCSRKRADQLMLDAMVFDKFDYVRREAAYRAVRLFGDKAWNENTADKAFLIKQWGLDSAKAYELRTIRVGI